MITHPVDELPGYVLGILEPEEQGAVDAHLAICGPCRDEVRALSETAWTVSATAERSAPAGLRDAIMSRATETGGVAPRPGAWAGLWAALRRPVPVAVPLALAAILVISIIGYGGARRDADRYASVVADAVGARVVPLAPTAANGARGSLVVPANGAAPYLILDLPPAAAGKTWEAWVIRGDVPARAGVTDAHGVLTLVLTAPLAPGDTVAITPEPAGGVDRPTGTAVLTGKS